VKEIYEKSTKNLLTALDFAESGIEIVRIYDNSEVGGDVKQVLTFRRGRPHSIVPLLPAYLDSLFRGQNSRSPPCERQCKPDRTRMTGHANGNNTLHPTTFHGHTFKSPQLSFPEPIVWSSKLRQPRLINNSCRFSMLVAVQSVNICNF
jgi:hypothetical protein